MCFDFLYEFCPKHFSISHSKNNSGTYNLPQHKPVGRPRTRWADVVQRDALQLLGVRGWRRRAENRDEWRHALRQTKARKGL